MINVNRTKIEIVGKENIICGELGIIFDSLIEHIGEEKTKKMINIALNTVIEENKKEYRKLQIKDKKDLKRRMKRDLPKDLADILYNLI